MKKGNEKTSFLFLVLLNIITFEERHNPPPRSNGAFPVELQTMARRNYSAAISK